MTLPEFDRGFQHGVRWAITWLHKRAEEMNDPSAKAAMNTACFHMGNELRDIRIVVKTQKLERALADAGVQSTSKMEPK